MKDNFIQFDSFPIWPESSRVQQSRVDLILIDSITCGNSKNNRHFNVNLILIDSYLRMLSIWAKP